MEEEKVESQVESKEEDKIDSAILDEYVEMIKRRNAKIASCCSCGAQNVQLVRVNKHDKNKGYICRACITKLFNG